MHAKQLAHAAMNMASVGQALLTNQAQANVDSAHGYWLNNRFRCDAWHQKISAHRSTIERVGTSRRRKLWEEILPTLEEILISEPLTRIVAYISAHLEQRGLDADWGPLSHSVLDNHVEARHRCLNLMVFGYGFPVERAVRLNYLRRQMESYSDQLLGGLPCEVPLDRYAFDLQTTAVLQRLTRREPVSQSLYALRQHALWASMNATISISIDPSGTHPQWNQGIAESTLAMLPSAVFDSFGVPRGRLRSTIAYVASDSHIATNDIDKPLAAPFDLLSIIKRHKQAKGGRLG